MKTLLVVNPVAGQKAGLSTNPATIDDVIAALTQERIRAEVVETHEEGDATRFALSAVAQGYDLVVAAGGDGTVSEVAQALVDTDVILGIVPLGSVMNVARMLHVPRDLGQAVHWLRAGRIVRIDVGLARDRYFLETGGVGIDAGIFAFANQIDAGEWSSVADLLRFVARYRPRRMTLRLDGDSVETRAMMVVVANGPYYGPGLPLVPQAKINDHRFDVRVFRALGRLELLRQVIAILSGRRYAPRVQEFRAQVVEVSSLYPLPVHADAHSLGTTPVSFQIVPEGLTVVSGTAAEGEIDALLPAAAIPERRIS